MKSYLELDFGYYTLRFHLNKKTNVYCMCLTEQELKDHQKFIDDERNS